MVPENFVMAHLYRVEAVTYAAPLDEFENPMGGGRTTLSELAFPITKITNKGCWIDVFGRKRFVNLHARKKYACETMEEAVQSFIKRKERQIKILTAQLASAKYQLTLANGKTTQQNFTTKREIENGISK